MFRRDYRDVIGGGALALFGLWFCLYSVEHYSLGTLNRMGPGMFPAMLGATLAVLGSLTAILAWFRQGEIPEIRKWTPLFVLSSVAAFALIVKPFGLIPAVLAVVSISSLAELRIEPRKLAMMCVVLSLIAWLTFGVGLGLTVPMINWPF